MLRVCQCCSVLIDLGTLPGDAGVDNHEIRRARRSAGIFKKFLSPAGRRLRGQLHVGRPGGAAAPGLRGGLAKALHLRAVLLFHAISTVSAYQQYISPFESHNLLFYAAWPMLAACFALYT